jgi:S1-C subfamily serine protease
MTVTQDLTTITRHAADLAGPAVVRIGRGGGRGCGVVVAPGLVLTNAHNLADRTTLVTFADGRAVQGAVAGADIDGDLAVLQVDTEGVAPLEWSTDSPLPGDVVFAVAATAAGGSRVTFGIVSGGGRAFRGPRGRLVTDAVEHTALLAPGSSGSPLVDADGRLAGINTNRLGDGFYLAVPAGAELRRRVDALARGEEPQTVRLGVGLAPAYVAARMRRAVGLPPRDGLLVRAVEEGSPAARAGLAVGDLLVAIGGDEVGSIDDLFAAVAAVPAEGTLSLRVVRGVDELDVAVSFDGSSNTEGTA